MGKRRSVLYAVLCYNAEEVVTAWTKEEDDAVMARLDVVHQRLIDAGKMGPSARLMPTTAATTLRKSDAAAVEAHLRVHGVPVGEIGTRYGAGGDGVSVYLADPEGNALELRG